MIKAKFQAAAFGGTPDDVEAAFYDAMQHGEVDKLMACWADEDDIVCVHPGGPRLMGPVAIRAAFEAMFANGTIQASPQHLRRVESVASAVHSLVERIEVMTPEGPRHAYVVATNVFHKLRRAGAWSCTMRAGANTPPRRARMWHRCCIDATTDFTGKYCYFRPSDLVVIA